jgi:hypothetical protein
VVVVVPAGSSSFLSLTGVEGDSLCAATIIIIIIPLPPLFFFLFLFLFLFAISICGVGERESESNFQEPKNHMGGQVMGDVLASSRL